MRPVAAGALYSAIVFAAGFVLGIGRTLALEPWLGALPAVLVELPVILTIAWLACGWVLRRLRVPARMPTRLAVGAVALALLLAAEIGLTVLLGRAVGDFLAGIATPAGATGLAGQVLFALLPAVRR